MTPAEPLRALLMTWREDADVIANTSHHGNTRAYALRFCADELEAVALALRESAPTPQDVEANSVLEAIVAVLDGEPISEFMESSTTVRAVLDLVSAARETWRDIASAPKDTPILTFRCAGLMAVAELITHPADFPKVPARLIWCSIDGCELLNVTHWMPLPAQPRAEEAKS